MELAFFCQPIWLAQVDIQSRDLLVAVVAIGLGINIVYAVLTNNRRCYELTSVKTLEKTVGKLPAQLILCGVGGICLLMGGFLISQSFGHRKNVATDSADEVHLPMVGMSSNSR